MSVSHLGDQNPRDVGFAPLFRIKWVSQSREAAWVESRPEISNEGRCDKRCKCCFLSVCVARCFISTPLPDRLIIVEVDRVAREKPGRPAGPHWYGIYKREKTGHGSKDGWPSGLRRCLKESNPAVFGRGFESHFIQTFWWLGRGNSTL